MEEDPMKKEIQNIANSDTPAAVKVPQDIASLVIWATGRFGIGIVGLAGLYIVYEDMKAERQESQKVMMQYSEKLIQAMDNSTKVQIEFKHALESNTKVIDDLRFRLNK